MRIRREFAFRRFECTGREGVADRRRHNFFPGRCVHVSVCGLLAAAGAKGQRYAQANQRAAPRLIHVMLDPPRVSVLEEADECFLNICSDKESFGFICSKIFKKFWKRGWIPLLPKIFLKFFKKNKTCGKPIRTYSKGVVCSQVFPGRETGT